MWLLALFACEKADNGASEAFRVRDGTFVEGDLPYDDASTTPFVVYAAATNFVVTQGTGNLKYSGLASKDAYSIAVWLPGQSTGYWVVPVDGPDVTQDGNYLFSLTADFGRNIDYKLDTLEFVAFDADGNAGPRYSATICILPDYAHGSFANCSPDIPPQHTILSLRWDTPVDLDLEVLTPVGKLVTSKTPTTAVDADEDGELDEDVVTGELSRDSNSNCAIDNFNLESLVFEDEPPAGDYTVYANLWSACGESSVRYAATLYQRVEESDGTWSMEATELPSGELLAIQQTAGEAIGTRLTSISLP